MEALAPGHRQLAAVLFRHTPVAGMILAGECVKDLTGVR